MTAKTPQQSLVTVFGGSGFLGRYVVRALARRGYRVRVAVRRPDLAGHLQPMGTVGQIHAVQSNLRYPESVASALVGADAAVNLVGILYESGQQTFEAVQAAGARTVAEAAAKAGITRFAHVSALGADNDDGPSYSQTKLEAERAVHEQVAEAAIFRPSVLFGPEDEFFNRFAAIARISPVMPLFGGGGTRFQPVYAGDVAEAVARVVDGQVAGGKVYELGGPEIMTLREVFEYVTKVTGRKRLMVPVPTPLAMFKAAFLQLLPKPMLTVDQVRLLAMDNVVSEAAKSEGRTLDGLGIAAKTVESIVPAYLYRFRRTGEFAPDTA